MAGDFDWCNRAHLRSTAWLCFAEEPFTSLRNPGAVDQRPLRIGERFICMAWKYWLIMLWFDSRRLPFLRLWNHPWEKVGSKNACNCDMRSMECVFTTKSWRFSLSWCHGCPVVDWESALHICTSILYILYTYRYDFRISTAFHWWVLWRNIEWGKINIAILTQQQRTHVQVYLYVEGQFPGVEGQPSFPP